MIFENIYMTDLFYYNQSTSSGLMDFRKSLAQSFYFIDVNTEVTEVDGFPQHCTGNYCQS